MDKGNAWLLLLDEGERRLAEAALAAAAEHEDLGGCAGEDRREAVERRLRALLAEIRARTGGFRLRVDGTDVGWTARALCWYASMFDRGTRERMEEVAGRLLMRRGGVEALGDFDPATYSPAAAGTPWPDLPARRIVVALYAERADGGADLDRCAELPRLVGEADAAYERRAAEAAARLSRGGPGAWEWLWLPGAAAPEAERAPSPLPVSAVG